MSWYAVGSLDDAVGATRSFLLPFDLGRWLRLAVVVFFLGGAGGGGGGVSNAANVGGGGTVPGGGFGPGFGPGGFGPGGGPDGFGPGFDPGNPLAALPVEALLSNLSLVFAVVGVLVLLGLLFSLVGAVMEFVFVDALRTDRVRVRGPFRRRFGKGLRLFGFRVALGALVLAPIVAAGALALLGAGESAPGVGLLALLALASGVVAVPVVPVLALTTAFVVPVMLVDDVGVLAGWRRFWPTLRAEWVQFLVFFVVRVLLGIGAGIAVTFVLGLFVVLALAFVLLLSGIVVLAFGSPSAALASLAGVVAFAVVGLFALLLLVAVVLPVRIVVSTYFRTYELLVLGAAADAYDLLAGRLTDDDSGGFGGSGGIGRVSGTTDDGGSAGGGETGEDAATGEDDRDASDDPDTFGFDGGLGSAETFGSRRSGVGRRARRCRLGFSTR